jgi:heparinase II/III-like protein
VNDSTFIARAKRAVRKPPRYLAWRAMEAARWRVQRPWSAVLPHLVTERSLLRQTGASNIDGLWTRLTERPFFLNPSSRATWTDCFRREYRQSCDRILADADRVLRHEFDLLGSGPTALGVDLPWLTDFKTGRTWPRQYCRDIAYDELDKPTDVKVPWELSRCQHFARLGQAYWLTGDDRYAQEYVDEIRGWIATNPYAWTVNWSCAMDVALRAVSWIWGFYFLADAPACQDRRFRADLLRSLFLHGEFIASHLEKADLNGNHYLCDGVGLVFLGCFFGDSARGRRWRALGREIVVSEIEQQVTPDGVDFEQSTAYHRLVLEGFLTSYLLLRMNGEHIPDVAWSRLERMCDYVDAYLKPNGLAPLVGDADDGRIQILGTQEIGDQRYLLSNGAVVFNRADLRAHAGEFADESFWMLGPDGLATFCSQPQVAAPRKSEAFADGGFFVLRAPRTHVFIDCGDVGMRGRGGHGHNDILSFELWWNGANLITDCGAYLYTASREWRNKFRSTSFHNVVQVDDEELNRFLGPNQLWQLHNDARPVRRAWNASAGGSYFRGGHTAYERLSPPVSVTRECFLPSDGRALVVRDRVDGAGHRRLTWRFHFDPAVQADLAGGGVRLRVGTVEASLQPAGISQSPCFRLEPAWVSPSYGVRAQTMCGVASYETDLPLSVTWIIADAGVGDGAPFIDALNAAAASATAID